MMTRSFGLSACLTFLLAAFPSGSMADIAGKGVLTYSLERNIVTATVVARDNRLTMTRRYQKPFSGGSRQVGFRTEDRAFYTFDCVQRRVALHRFDVVAPRRKTVFSNDPAEEALNWRIATGPEWAMVFSEQCGVDLADPETPMHPDQWLSDKKRADNADSAPDLLMTAYPIDAVARALSRQTPSVRVEIKLSTQGDFGLAPLSFHVDFKTPVDLTPGNLGVSQLDARLLFDCQTRRMIAAETVFHYADPERAPSSHRYAVDNTGDLSLWLPVPRSGLLAQCYDTLCLNLS